MPRRALLLLGALAVFTFSARLRWVDASCPGHGGRTLNVNTASDRPKLQLQGAGSCAAAACHNGQGVGIQGREYALALERDIRDPHQRVRDRHAQAYDVLFDPLAQQIERSLHPDAPPRPETDALCLRCHVHPSFDSQPVRLRDGVAQFRLEDGVSCEACHGPAERWLAAHFRSGWTALSASDRLAQGQSHTRSLPGRIRLCVDCHVGAPGMEVNHDLIAAGHPRLGFEFASFHFLLHKHWDYAKDRDPSADPRGRRDFEARAWALGQLTSTRAALALLADRAADRARPWPEFAEYDCAACHHDLRTPPAPARRKLAALPLSQWYTALVPDAFTGLAMSFDAPMRDALADVRAAMETNRPDRRQVADRARRAIALLDRRLADVQERAAPLPVNALLRQIARNAGKRAALRADDTAQVYLAIAALRRAQSDMALPQPPLALPRLRDLLQLAPMREHGATFSPAALRATLDALQRDEPR